MANRCTIAQESRRISIRFSHEDTDTWHEIKDSLRDDVPYARWDHDRKCWHTLSGYLPEVRKWAHEWYAAGEIADSAGDAYSGRHSSGPPPVSAPSRLESAYQALYLLPSAPIPVVLAAHRALVKMHHPDIGGDTAVMARVNAAMDKIKGARL